MCKVTMSGMVKDPQLWLAIPALFGRPVKESLKALKAHLEGNEDKSISTNVAALTEVARFAQTHCGCS
jgi:hypothetical protein